MVNDAILVWNIFGKTFHLHRYASIWQDVLDNVECGLLEPQAKVSTMNSGFFKDPRVGIQQGDRVEIGESRQITLEVIMVNTHPSRVSTDRIFSDRSVSLLSCV
jgi:hypothetical protein